MKPIRLISTGTLALFLGVLAPAYAQQDQGAKPEQHEQKTKPAKQHAARPAKQEKQQQRQARTQPTHEKTQPHQRQHASAQQHGLPPGQWAHSGQKDSRGHEYSPARFGPDHHARFEQNSGRVYNGHREYAYGGYWFYADTYPAWFYQQDVYFIMGADGLWYAVAYGDPSLMIQVYIQ
ncbi:MAG TPA: hypothetical protein VME18_09515 [Acidobacteriaceae bacterium]|nr:hypothetical protein [Acidobacteriaceae bacterium]